MKYLFNTVEMFCKLDKDRNKVFKRKVDGLEIKILPRTHSNDNLPNCCYYWESGYPSLSPNDEWEEVPTEVTWQEAIKAWASGKAVRCILPTGSVMDYEGEYANILNREIIDGKWYII